MFLNSLIKKNNTAVIQSSMRIEKISVGLGILFFYASLFFALRDGVGQYWDWTFPLFKEHISSFFSNNYLSWTLVEHGSTLSYSSDYFFRFLVSQLTIFNPEHVLYALIVALFSAGTFGSFLLLRNYTNAPLAVLGGVAIFVNPVIFYKMTAGHLNFLVSFVVFIFFVHFLLFHYRKSIKSAIIAGLHIAFVGAQIQFFAFAYLFFGLFVLYKKKLFTVTHFFLAAVLPLLINWFWISNFFLTENISEEVVDASTGVFDRAINLDVISILNLSFSDATLITQFFYRFEMVFFLGLFFFLLMTLSENVKKVRAKQDSFFFTVNIITLIIVAIVVLPVLNLGPLSPFQALLREVGHFAPVILFFVLLAIISFYGSRPLFIKMYLGIFISLNTFHYATQLPAINFSEIREKFSEFEAVPIEEGYRALSYPFWGQYEFLDQETRVKDNFRLSNTGWDSFSKFNQLEDVHNYVSASDFSGSVQKHLFDSHDMNVLTPYGVKYLFDFTSIYESHFNKYVPESVYEKNLSIVKNDELFFEKIQKKNADSLKQISPRVYEVVNPLPRVFTLDNMFNLNIENLNAADREFISDYVQNTNVFFTVDRQEEYLTDFYPLFRDVSSIIKDEGIKEQVSTSKEKNYELYYSTAYDSLQYSLRPNSFNYQYLPEINLLSDSLSLQSEATGNGQFILLENDNVVLEFSREALKPGLGTSSLPSEFTREPITLVQLGENLVPNPSFEEGSWNQSVQNCHAYDDDPQIEMRVSDSGSVGNSSLDLISTRHIACTFTDFDLPAEVDVGVFSLQYKTEHLDSGGYDLIFLDEFGEAVGSSTKITINNIELNTDWQTHSRSIEVPDEAANTRLYLYSFPTPIPTPVLTSYDDVNFSIVATSTTIQNDLPISTQTYSTVPFNVLTATSTITYSDTLYNLIENSDFSNGPWQDSVEDCFNVDDNVQISMEIASGEKSYLTLAAQTHVACTHQEINLPWYSDTLFFSYEYSCDENRSSRYSIIFDDLENTVVSGVTDCSDNDWDTYSTTFEKPVDASSAVLYIYTDSFDGITKNKVSYSEFKLHVIPTVENRFYITGEPQIDYMQPYSIEFHSINATKRLVEVTGATTPFYLAMSESHHPQWQLQFANDKIRGFFGSWVPFVSPDVVSSDAHFELNGFLNGWYVDVDQYCRDDGLCVQNADGSYDIEFVIEFFPQRWFYLGLLISSLTLLGCLMYLGYDWRRRQV